MLFFLSSNSWSWYSLQSNANLSRSISTAKIYGGTMLYANSSREYVILYTVAHITEKRYYMALRMCSCQWAMRAIFFRLVFFPLFALPLILASAISYSFLWRIIIIIFLHTNNAALRKYMCATPHFEAIGFVCVFFGFYFYLCLFRNGIRAKHLRFWYIYDGGDGDRDEHGARDA